MARGVKRALQQLIDRAVRLDVHGPDEVEDARRGGVALVAEIRMLFASAADR